MSKVFYPFTEQPKTEQKSQNEDWQIEENYLNLWGYLRRRYPNVDLYANSFAGGASGYPLMFENYKHNERIKIANKDKIFLRKKN